METKNLLIRETIFEDCKYFAQWESDPGVIEFLTFEEGRTYEDVVEDWFRNKWDQTKLQYTVVKKDGNIPIGRIYVSRYDEASDSLDVTKLYIAGDENKGKGYGKEMMIEFLEYCFVFLHMERVTLDHYTGNKAAAALYDKLGFQYEGVARNACKKNGKYYDLHLMSMLRGEFFDKIHDK